MSDRFKNNRNAKLVYNKLNDLEWWLVKDYGLGLQAVIDEKLKPLKSNVPESDIKKYEKGLKKVYKTKKYKNQKDIIVRIWGDLKTKQLVYVDGKWHFVNKLNTNYSDLSELITELFIRGNKINDVLHINQTQLKEYLLGIKEHISKLLDKYFMNVNEYLDFTNKSTLYSRIGEYGEKRVADFLRKNGFTIEYRGGNGDFIDMLLGIDMIVSLNGEYFSIQCKPDNKYNYVKDENYKNVDWLATYNEPTGIKFYEIPTGKEILPDLMNREREDDYYGDYGSYDSDDLLESFIDTGKLTITETEDLYGGTINVAGEDFNFETIWKMFYPESDYYENLSELRYKLKKIVLRYTEGDEDAAKDIYDEVFIKRLPSALFKNGGKVFKEFNDLYNYISISLRNMIREFANREKKERKRKKEFDSEIYYDDNKERQDQKDKLINAINSIDDFKKRYVLLGRLGGAKFEEIVDEWNETYSDDELSLGAAKMIYKRALPQLKDYLENIDESIENFFDTGKLL